MTVATYQIPKRYEAPLQAYVTSHAPTCHFLAAVLTNDLARACREGQHDAIANLPAIIAWLHENAPEKAWGNADRVAAWIASYDDGLPF